MMMTKQTLEEEEGRSRIEARLLDEEMKTLNYYFSQSGKWC